MAAIAVLPRVLGTLFYYSPISEQASGVIASLRELPTLLDWQEPGLIEQAAQQMCAVDPEQLTYQFSLLFEGQGHMPAPPWGSVYLNQENLLLGETSLDYRRFLAEHQLALDTQLNEPDDQFGLMLLAMAYFMEAENDEAVETLLAVHLLPWAGRYLELVADVDETGFYRALAQVAKAFLGEVAAAYEVSAESRQLHF